MDSTMVYELVLEQLHKKQELVNLIPSLTHLTQPQAPVHTPRMNDQQIFKQIHSHVSAQLSNIEKDKEEILSTLQHQDMEEVGQEEQVQIDEQGMDMEGEQQAENDWEPEEEDQQNPYGQIDEQEEEFEDEGMLEEGDGDQGQEEQEQGQQEQDSGEEGLYDGEDDVGLYGERIDDEELESYANEVDQEEERQFKQEQKQLKRKSKLYKNHQQQEEEDKGEDLLNDQFDNFREIELQNKEEPQTTEQQSALHKQIQKYENKIMNKKDWVLQGEVKGTQRPVNSLLEFDLQFKTGLKINQEVTKEYNQEVETIIKQRVLDQLYDDRVRYQHSHVLREQYSSLKEVSTEKSKLGLAELYESEFKNYLGLADNKQDKLRKQIFQAFRQVNYCLDSLSNHHFTPRPNATQSQAIISQQKVPITMFGNSNTSSVPGISHKFQSEKEENKKAKRTKNKRIARQRKKEQDRKKLNKKIEYGGVTKFEAKAMTKRATNNKLNKDPIKYNKSSNFFQQMNKEKGGKPNPNLNKLKI